MATTTARWSTGGTTAGDCGKNNGAAPETPLANTRSALDAEVASFGTWKLSDWYATCGANRK